MKALLWLMAGALLLPACAESLDSPADDPAAFHRARLCAEENPLDRAAQRDCEQGRARLADPAPSDDNGPTVALTAPNLGQGLIDLGRQMAAPPVLCTSVRVGSFVSTTCR